MSDIFLINEDSEDEFIPENEMNLCPNSNKTYDICDVSKELNINVESLKCPITHEIFYDPVIAMDGIIYERNAIEDWLTKKSTSPIKREDMKHDLIDCAFIKNIVSEFLEKHSEYKCEQYKPDMSFSANIPKIKILIKDKRFDKILEYHSFDLKYMMDNNSMFIESMKDEKAAIHILDNAIDIDCTTESDWRPLTKICYNKYKPSIIKHILTKKVDLNRPITIDNGKWTPLNIVLRYGNTESMMVFIEQKGVVFENNVCSPLILAAEYCNQEIIKTLFKKMKDIKVNNNGRNIIDLIKVNNVMNNDNKKALLTELSTSKDFLEMMIDSLFN